MIQFRKPLIFLSGLFLLAAAVGPRLASAQAAFYKYLDKNGNIHFTDRLESIPEEHRDQIKVYREEVKPEMPSAPAKEEKQDSAAKSREGEPKGRAAEVKDLQQKPAEEERSKAREAREKRISELQAQIRAKQQEQKNLRTTWMVYDRTKLNQLNAEIAALEKQIESLQKEMGEER